MSFKRIFVALDNSELSHQVFTQALELAIANQANLMLFHEVAVGGLGDAGVPIPVELGMNVELMEQAYQVQHSRIEHDIERVQGWLRNYCETATNQGVSTEFDYKVGEEAGHAICQAAQNWAADLVVLGRRGRTGLAEAILGSVSNYVVHHAPGCVLVIQEKNS